MTLYTTSGKSNISSYLTNESGGRLLLEMYFKIVKCEFIFVNIRKFVFFNFDK